MDLKEAANRLGVHYQTAYQWVREGRLQAEKIGAAYQVDEQELLRFALERAKPSPPPSAMVVRDWRAQQTRLHQSLTTGDETSARAQLQRLVDGRVSVIDIFGRLIAPVLRAIGDEWANGLVSIAIEHRASSIIERSLSGMMTSPPGRPKGIAVVCTPSGEEHSLPALMAATVLRQHRWTTHYLGVDMPLKDLASFVASVDADLVVISTTLATSLDVAHHYRKVLEAQGVQVIVGHPGESLESLLSIS